MLLLVPPEKQQAVKDALPGTIHVPFTMESSGSQIIFYDPEEDYSALEADRAQQQPRAFRELTEIHDEETRKSSGS